MQNAFGQEYQTKPVNNNATPNTNYCEKTNGDLIRWYGPTPVKIVIEKNGGEALIQNFLVNEL